MDFLKDLALPQSMEHYHLVVLLAAISSMVFIPYIAFLLGSTAVSLWFERRSRIEKNPLYLVFARTLTEIPLYSKSVVGFLAVIPGLSLVFSYAQMMHGTTAATVGFSTVGFVFLLAGCILLYTYKYTFRLQDILTRFRNLSDNGHPQDHSIDTDVANNEKVHYPAGRYGLVFLTLAVFLYGSAVSITADPGGWTGADSLLSLLISGTAWMRFLFMLALAAGVTGTGILFFTFGWTDLVQDAGEAYRTLASRVATRLLVGSLAAIPVLLAGRILVASPESFSGPLFGLIGMALLFFFLAANFFYGYVRTRNTGSVAYGLFAFVLAAVFVVLSDHVAIGSATKSHAATLAYSHDRAMDALKLRLGVGAPALTGAEIYDAKCSACHLFDTKKVGPPYNVVLKKYAGKKAEMIAFVLNPVKVDPEYPSMPSQGLRPAEADSIVSYLLAKYGPAPGK